MSILSPVQLHCPQCRKPLAFDAVHSVNADRRPDLRAAILDGSFQRQSCPHCSATFRLDPAFNYVDLKRKQWIAVEPMARINEWDQREAAARDLFAVAYGERASAPARRLGAGLKPRLVFGWPALREKLIAAEAGLDDEALELLKLALLRSLSGNPFEADVTLRLLEVADDGRGDLLLGWVRESTGATAERRVVPRHFIEEIVAEMPEPEGRWSEARDAFAGALFVDANRLMIEPTPAQA